MFNVKLNESRLKQIDQTLPQWGRKYSNKNTQWVIHSSHEPGVHISTVLYARGPDIGNRVTRFSG